MNVDTVDFYNQKQGNTLALNSTSFILFYQLHTMIPVTMLEILVFPLNNIKSIGSKLTL